MYFINKNIILELLVRKNINGQYYITTSHPNIYSDKDIAQLLKKP